jgi:NADPH:quinone reductase
MSTQMTEAIITPGPTATPVSIPSPTLLPTQILTRVIYTGTNPKDWKRAEYMGQKTNQGDDIAGIVYSVGSAVKNFRAGDRVLALHHVGQAGGSFADYAVSYDFSTVHIPDSMTFEEAATLPMVFNTAAVALYSVLGLPMPMTGTKGGEKRGIVVYGASTSVGAMTVQLAKLSQLHPVVAIAGSSSDYVSQFLDKEKGDVLLDYREGEEKILEGINAALKNANVKRVDVAVDAFSEGASTLKVAKALSAPAKIARVLPVPEGLSLPAGVSAAMTISPQIFNASEEADMSTRDFGAVMFRFLERGLEGGWLKALPYEVVKGEGEWWAGVEKALTLLKRGEARGRKFVVGIGKE